MGNDIYSNVDSMQKALDCAIRDYELQGCGDKCGYVTSSGKGPYWNYMKNNVWEGFLKSGMLPIHKAQYLDADGGELSEKNSRYGMMPPKMASYGSSSRFIHNLSKGVEGFCFEKQLPTRVGHTANLDGFLHVESHDIYVEAKCREIYSHTATIKVSNVYEPIYEHIQKINNCFVFEKKGPGADDFKCSFSYNGRQLKRFDIKQFICHLLGVSAYILENNGNTNIKFLYLIFNPNANAKFSHECTEKYMSNILNAYNETIEEIKSLGDMKWLFEAIMSYQCEHLHLKPKDTSFVFCVVDQNSYLDNMK